MIKNYDVSIKKMKDDIGVIDDNFRRNNVVLEQFFSNKLLFNEKKETVLPFGYVGHVMKEILNEEKIKFVSKK